MPKELSTNDLNSLNIYSLHHATDENIKVSVEELKHILNVNEFQEIGFSFHKRSYS